VELTPPRRVYVAQGGRDYQVTGVDFERWQKGLAGRPRTRTKLYPALDHLLAAGEGKSTPEDYRRAAAVDATLLDDLAAWIRARD
jgi:hypothetical protein